MNPTCAYYLWDREASEGFLRAHFPTMMSFYRRITLGMTQADFLRIAILHHHGGVFADLDVECIAPFRSWALDPSRINVAFEPPEHGVSKIGCAVFVSGARNGALAGLLRFGMQHFSPRRQSETFYNMEAFGPLLWRRFYAHSPSAFFVVPTARFFPIPDVSLSADLRQKYADVMNRGFPDAYCVHYWDHINVARGSLLRDTEARRGYDHNHTRLESASTDDHHAGIAARAPTAPTM